MKKVTFEVWKNGHLIETFILENATLGEQIIASLKEKEFDPSIHTLLMLHNSLQIESTTILENIPAEVRLLILPKESKAGGGYPATEIHLSDVANEPGVESGYKSTSVKETLKGLEAMESIRPPFSNMQVELLNLYATGVPDEYLPDIRRMIAKYLFEKASDRADKVWDEKGYSEETLKKWINGNE